MSTIFHPLSRSQLPPGSDSFDMNNKASTFGLHPSFASNSRAYSQVPASYRNNVDPLRRQMTTVRVRFRHFPENVHEETQFIFQNIL